jgi:nanoRNase/pAp phosphatase (c-di-AMP/oligoRNAs hydrolase)
MTVRFSRRDVLCRLTLSFSSVIDHHPAMVVAQTSTTRPTVTSTPEQAAAAFGGKVPTVLGIRGLTS